MASNSSNIHDGEDRDEDYEKEIYVTSHSDSEPFDDSLCDTSVKEDEVSHVSADGASNKSRIQLPAKYFTFMHDQMSGKGFKVKCLLCHMHKTKYGKNGKAEYLSITNNSVYNAKRHIKTKHPSHLSDFIASWRNKREESTSQATSNETKKMAQTKLSDHLHSSSSKFKQIRTQEELDEAILNHVIADLLPLSEIEKDGFQKLIGGLIGPLVIKSRRSMMEILNQKYARTKSNLISELEKVDYVSTTADCWTSHRKSFLGMTVHWLGEGKDSKEIIRRSACLGVRRLYGAHTYDVLAKAMSNLHAEFRISNKVNITITDNGSNFLKAFKMFPSMEKQDLPEASCDEDDLISDEDDSEDVIYVDIGLILDHRNNIQVDVESGESCGLAVPTQESEIKATQDEMEFDSDSDICDVGGRIFLPRHFRCTCHSLNLIATADVKTITNRQFTKLKKQLDLKLSAVWNKQSRSSLASDFIRKTIGELFVIHNVTRWNSYYNAMCKVHYFVSKKNEELQTIFEHFKLKKLSAAEQEFLKEFIKVMKPISQALDVFQNEEAMSLGCVLPVITILKDKLTSLQQDRGIVHCIPLVNCLFDGVSRRFDTLFDDDHMRLAAISDPHFKLSWVPEESKSNDIVLLKKEVQRRANAIVDANESSCDETSQSDSSPIKKKSKNRFLNSLRKRASTEIGEVDRYFNDVAGSLEDLSRFPTIKQIFMEYNSALPSSAACERLFSTAGLIFVPKRSNLSDSNFDKLVFLKQNGMSSRNWQSCPSKTTYAAKTF
ncbi:uncharacterized protein LOC130698693 [Daphnia carinata]|uniref:uncharacterized protein LOC130698693 n=1 Tax=Daphnia carinata TaxID=120202 RepID=UPI00257B3A96|nr:uncharacterized protein LOC130698693 [Daphnia carinata]